MCIRFWTTAALALSVMTNTVAAQDFVFQPINFDSAVRPSTYVAILPAQDDDSSDEDDEDEAAVLKEQLARMELRLRELENDVEEKLDTYSDAASESEEADEEFEERLEELEDVIEAQDKLINEFENTLPGLVYHRHQNPRMQFFGRIHTDYWAFPKVDDSLFPLEASTTNPTGDPQDRVIFRRLRIGVEGNLLDNMVYRYEGEFADEATASYRDAYVGFTDLPFLNTVLIGNQKRPYGLDHLNDSNYGVFMERSLAIEAFNEDNRRLGIATYGLSDDLNTNWRFGLFNQQLTQNLDGWRSDDYQLEFAGRIAGTPWYDESSGGRGYLHLGLSGSYGFPDGGAVAPGAPNQARYRTRPEARSDGRWLNTGRIAGAEENMLIGLEAVMNVGAWNFAAEYQRVNVERTAAIGNDVGFGGGYLQAAYFLTGEHMPWDRRTGTLGRVQPFENFFLVRDCDCETKQGLGAWQVAARYSWADLSDEDILGGEGQSLTLALNWHFNPFSRFQFNYINGDIFNNAAGVGNYEIFGARMMVDF